MPTTTEDPKPNRALLDGDFLALMDDGLFCHSHTAAYKMAMKLLCDLSVMERELRAGVLDCNRPLRWGSLVGACEVLDKAVRDAGRVCHLALCAPVANRFLVADADELADAIRRRVQADLALLEDGARHE